MLRTLLGSFWGRHPAFFRLCEAPDPKDRSNEQRVLISVMAPQSQAAEWGRIISPIRGKIDGMRALTRYPAAARAGGNKSESAAC